LTFLGINVEFIKILEEACEMKSLATISAWILFIYGCVMLLNTIIQSVLFGLSEEMTMVGGGIAMLVSFLQQLLPRYQMIYSSVY
jgi:hypothetical protein